MSRISMNEYVVVDLETTGLDIEKDEIIEIAAVRVRRGLLMDEFHSLVRCSRPLTEEITALTGIDSSMLEGQPSMYALLPDFAEFVGDAVPVAHNASFDSQFLQKYWQDERPWLDTLTLTQIAFPCLPAYSLANLCNSLQIGNEQAHRALSDARATAEIFIQAEKAISRLPLGAKNDILRLAEEDDSPLGQLLRSKCQDPGASAVAQPEKQSSPRAGERRCIDEEYQLNIEQVSAYLEPESQFPQRLERFEARPQQLKMSQAVARAFNERRSLLVEAGTGTGKSLAYLLPAALFAQGSGNQVAVSTHTRNLQEQLLEKDIPMLSCLLGREVKAAVLKGRSNYLCARMYRYYSQQPPENLRYFLMRVAVWKANSQSGDGAELSLSSYERAKWNRICAAKENCVPFCPFARKNACWLQRARIKAGDADILVLNHSLLVANAAIDKGFLPSLSYLIIDEAQHLEHAAEEQLSSKVDIYEILNALSRMKRRERGKAAGALALIGKFSAETEDRFSGESIERQLGLLDLQIEESISAAERFFALMSQLIRGELLPSTFYPAKIRLTRAHKAHPDWPLLLQQNNELQGLLLKLSSGAFRLLDMVLGCANENEDDQFIRPPGCDELQSAASLLRDLAGILAACFGDDENYVSWVEISEPGKRPSVNTAPLEIDRLLSDCLYQAAEAMVFTSATIAAGKDFGYFKSRLGLDLLPEPPREMILSSPFQYREQAVFSIINDLPDWTKCTEVEATQRIAEALISLLSASAGRAIVLFTSHHQLKNVYQLIRAPLSRQGISVLAHGISGGPSLLLQRLKGEERCCILGANSFWEGVDVIGDALSLIVVVRLPFWPPNTPLAASRMERLEAAGKSSFREFSMPQALIRFKQGFGRLIRSDTDQGVFCVLDKRIIEKSYGRSFITALPEMRRVVGTTEEIAGLIHRELG
ncbi:MAG: exonuclease domain-containing protein [Bacillota bacterium]|nr:exonuclease domain-containing protein [Bacillota bacterium]